ncbi:hypothetical protein DFS34DRAFT_596159 [Phlyctochytrium arcticum]|nr:hypothetical protein DFS34DRAFT_596159 [Phlyctochytrium arcticum]
MELEEISLLPPTPQTILPTTPTVRARKAPSKSITAATSSLAAIIAEAEADLSQFASQKTLPLRAKTDMSISVIAELGLQTRVMEKVQQAAPGFQDYAEGILAENYILTYGKLLKEWPVTLAVLTWMDDVGFRYSRQDYPGRLVEFCHVMGAFYVATQLQEPVYFLKKDKDRSHSWALRGMVVLLLRAFVSVEANHQYAIQFFSNLSKKIPGLNKPLNPSAPEDILILILIEIWTNPCDFTGLFWLLAALLVELIVEQIAILWEADGDELPFNIENVRQPRWTLEEVTMYAMGSAYTAKLPAEWKGDSGRVLLTWLLVATITPLQDRTAAFKKQEDSVTAKKTQTGKKRLRNLANNWETVWDAISSFHMAAPIILGQLIGENTGSLATS